MNIIIFLYFFISIILSSCFCFIVPKCCSNNQSFNSFGSCVYTNVTFILPNEFEKKSEFIEIIEPNRRPTCTGYLLKPDRNYTIGDDGQLITYYGEVFNNRRYCIEFISNYDSVLPFLCFKETEDETALVLYSSGYFISAVFISVTLIIFSFIPQLRTFQGKLMLSYLCTILIAFICTGIAQAVYIKDDLLCQIIGYSVQYFFLATFFWLNIMCIDIYLAFSSVRLRGSRGGDIRKLVFYSLYAWGMPLIILLITVGVDFSDLVPDNSPFKPKIGIQKCFFDDRSSAYMYFYGPMGVLICTNLILFAITAYRIWRTSNETAALNRGDSRRHSDKQENERFKLYVKLFLVMGINWVAELISFILGKQVPQYFWYLTDLTNTLQGVFIFIIFVWKRRVRRLIWDRVCMMTGRSTRISRSSRGGTSSEATDATSINNTAVSQLRLKPIGLVK